MSLSQKHHGKILVPWYNTSEWKYVYDILINKDESEYFKILHILKNWKIRAPLLSAGVEGTLILLETMSQNKTPLSDEQIVQTYSLCLMRFLNLTAGNSEKQGTFYKTVTKNELPKWLIEIRHDIAHNNKLPSKAILEVSINQCLDWVIMKYWIIQNKKIKDYVVTHNPKDTHFTEYLCTYCELIVSLYYGKNITKQNNVLLEKVNYFITKRHNKDSTDFYGVLKILEEILNQSVQNIEWGNSIDDIVNIFINEKALFAFINEVDMNTIDDIPDSFLMIWSNILNILDGNNFLYSLAKKLHEITNDLLNCNYMKEASSLWLKAIFKSLLKLKFKDTTDCDNLSENVKYVISSTEANFIQFDPNILDIFDAKMFEKLVLKSANIYTLNFLAYLLYFNENLEHEVTSLVQLVKSMSFERYCNEVPNFEEIEDFIQNHEEIEMMKEPMIKQTTKLAGERNKWVVVKNKLDFEGCPIGILPHQDRSKNPCLLYI